MKKKVILCIMIFILAFVVAFFVRVKLIKNDSTIHVANVTTKKDKKTEKQVETKTLSNVWKHKVKYNDTEFEIPCKYTDLEKVFDIKYLDKNQSSITLDNGDMFYINTKRPEDTGKTIEDKNKTNVYGVSFTNKKMSVAGIKVGMSSKKALELLGEPNEKISVDDSWNYYNPNSKTDNISESFSLRMQDDKVEQIIFFYDASVIEVVE